MAHFAEIDENNIVKQVLCCTQEDIDNSGLYGDPENWIQTSYNTRGGKHYEPNGIVEDDKAPLRKNYAGIGYTYDEVRDAFIPPIPYSSWILNEESCLWEAPVPEPTRDMILNENDINDGGWWDWNEEKETWDVWIWNEEENKFKSSWLFDKAENVWKKIEE